MARSLLSLITLLVLLAAPIMAEGNGTFTEIYQDTYNGWINGDIDSSKIMEVMADLESDLGQETGDWENAYRRTKVALVIGHVYFEDGETDLSIVELERSQQLAQESIEMRDNSDSWRLMADAGSYIMLQKGMGYIMANSSKVQDQAEMALELDPANARASLIIAQYLVNAPGIAGGNKNEGIEILQELTTRNNLKQLE